VIHYYRKKASIFLRGKKKKEKGLAEGLRVASREKNLPSKTRLSVNKRKKK